MKILKMNVRSIAFLKRKRVGTRGRPLAAALAFFLVMTVWGPLSGGRSPAFADAAGAFLITGGASGADYTYTSNTLTIHSSKSMTIAMNSVTYTTTDTISIVSSAKTANLTLSAVSIDRSGTEDACALNVDGATLNLTLKGANKLKSALDRAGLELSSGGNVVIDGPGSLEASSPNDNSSFAAGIGGGSDSAAGDVTINGGVVSAEGATAGIGDAGPGSSMDKIVINGGVVNATGGSAGGAGIGGGDDASDTTMPVDITINGGVVNATGGSDGGAGIGAGNATPAGDITINGGVVNATGGAVGGAGVGGGYSGSSAGDILISGGAVNAVGGPGGGAGIGGGYDDSSADNITINGGVVNAAGGADGGAGVGVGREGDYFEDSDVNVITINGGVIAASYADAGVSQDIGNSSGGNASAVVINGGSIRTVRAGVTTPAAIAPGPKNAQGASVYLNTLTLGANGGPFVTSGTAITAGNIDGVPCTQNGVGGYGIRDVKTDDNKVFLYLTETSSEKWVQLTANDKDYGASYIREANDKNSAALSFTPRTVDIQAISGVTPPVTGEAPVSVVTGTNQYTGAVSWSPTIEGSTFVAGQKYTATITLTAEYGYTFKGVSANFFNVQGANPVTNSAGTDQDMTVTAVFPATDSPVSIKNISGVAPPVAGQEPVRGITDAEYTGTVSWSPDPAGVFGVKTVYTATITLVAASGYTFKGVEANFFEIQGAETVTNPAGTDQNMTVTARFPATGATVTIAKIDGVVPPVAGDTPADAIVPTDQFTGTVRWSPQPGAGGFAPGTVYTATITLTPKTGYTCMGVAADFFEVAGSAVASNDKDGNIVTAVFQKTDLSVDHRELSYLSPPVYRDTPVTAFTDDAYDGVVKWYPPVGDEFASATVYTATVTLAARAGYTFVGVGANSFDVPGADAVTNPEGAGRNMTVTARFPATDGPVTLTHIAGVTPPVTGKTPVSEAPDTGQFTGAVTWSPGPVSGVFASDTVYTATITLKADPYYTFVDVPADFFTVEGATTVNNATGSGVVTAVFPATGAEKSALRAALDQAEAIARGTQTDESWNALQTAIGNGEVAYGNTTSTQAQVDAATSEVNAAIEGLIYNRTVTFNANGGSKVSSCTVTEGSPVGTLPTSKRTGYTLTGWYTAAGSGGSKISAATEVTQDVTFYAHWKAKTYSVKFHSGTKTIKTYKRAYGSKIGKLPKVKKKGYVFKGWYTKKKGGSKVKTSSKVSKNVTYYARWARR
jgi:uncharacterized repeat protein (TIGR02543 family)